MAVDFYVLALWFAYSLAFAISVAFLYYAYKRSIEQTSKIVVKAETTYFIDVKDERAYAMLDLAEELVDSKPNRAVELAREAVDLLLSKACRLLEIEAEGSIEEKVKKLRDAGMVFPPEFGQAPMLRRPKDVVTFAISMARFLREAPIVVKKGEGPSV